MSDKLDIKDLAMPSAAKIIAEKKIDVSKIQGTGLQGRITKGDVLLYLNLMKFWKEKFPNSIYDARYEKIIEDPENEIKKMIKFCDLDWEENCLKFYNNKTPIKTLSTAQARKPIYKSSKNSFEKFAPYLTDLNKLI